MSRPTLRPRPVRLAVAAALAGVLAAPALPLHAQEAPGKVLTLADYGAWNRVTQVALSPDGAYLTYTHRPNDGDPTLFVERVDDGRVVHEAVAGASPAFSDDARWIALLTSPPEEEAEKLRRERRPVPRALELVALPSGEVTRVEDVASFEFSEDGRWLAVLKARADREADHEGADLVLRDLRGGAVRNVGNVSELAFDEGSRRLAYVVDAADQAGNGLYVLELASGTVTPLDTHEARYARVTWNEAGTALAVLRGETPDGMEERANGLLAFDLGRGAAATVFDPAAASGFPEGHVLSEKGRLAWSEDGSRVFVGIRRQRPAVEREGDEPRADVDVWHWKDEELQSRQMVQADGDRRFTYLSSVHVPSGAFVRLADEDMPRVERVAGDRWAVGRHDAPYRLVLDQPTGLHDLVRIDVATGERRTLAEAVRYGMGTSPDGRWHVYSVDGTLFLQDLASGATRDLSAAAPVSFLNVDADRPSEKPTYGLAGWSADGRHVLVNHRWDVWMLPLEEGGEAVNLTAGMGDAERIRFRVVQLDEEAREDRLVDTSRPVLLSAYGDRTKRSGYFRARPGRRPEALLWEDRMVDDVMKAERAERLAFTRQTFTEFGDWWVSDGEFRGARKVTDANPQMADFRWSPGRVLVDYTDDRGNELQATLTLPAGYVEGRRYPMVVYFYEKMSQNHHQFSLPVYDDRPHMSTYASDGYLVLMPDIVYTDGRPGSSALDDVTAAVERVVELGYADPARIGLQGHSWGGYQSSYIVTQTDLFAAVVTGAPLTNLVSMHNILYKASGGGNAPLIQFGQGRMAASPWDDWALYAEQSPVHQAEGITTPFLILHGTEDGAVDWNQGLEFYVAARRLGKEVILLSYPGEPHHLQREENQKDFQLRMKQYFDHHLKGAPAPSWMTDGVPHLEKDRAAPTDGLPRAAVSEERGGTGG